MIHDNEENLNIEREKLALERRRLEIEMAKARWSAFSIVVPLVAVLCTVMFGWWSTYKQSEIQFQTEAAKAVMQSSSADSAITKAGLLKDLFPDRLPKDFAQNISPDKWVDIWRIKEMFFTSLAARDLNAQQAIELWRFLFPGDQFAQSKELDTIVARPRP